MSPGGVELEHVIPGAQGRVLGALVRLDGPRTISDLARLAGVSRDRAAGVVNDLERMGVVERRQAGRSHLVSLIDEHPITRSLRDIEHARDRSIEALRQSARRIDPAPVYMALFGSWARAEATDGSDLDVAVVAGADLDDDAFLEALETWSRFAERVTSRHPSFLIVDRLTKARGPVWAAVRRDAIVLIDRAGGDSGA